MKKEFAIHTKMLEVALWLFEKANTFPKKQRFVLGQQIENSSLNCLRFIIEANDASCSKATLHKLDKLNVELAVLRDLARMAYELKFLKAESLQYIIIQIDEVGKMRGGWVKHHKSSNNDNCTGVVAV
jgi:four helix bundle protein